MKITVVTVCFNSAASIAATLESVATQTYPTIEHIVIDGASTDDTVNIVRDRGKHVARLTSEPDRGIYDAMNKGLSLATGDVVGFLNSDDVFAHSQVVERIAHAMHSHQVDALFGDLVFVRPNDPDRVVRYWKSGPYRRGRCATGWMPAHPTFYVRRAKLEQHGGFDLSFRIAADFELALRLLDIADLKSVYLPEVLIRMRTGGESTRGLASIIAGNREASKACRKHGLPGGMAFVAGKLLAKLPQLVRRPRQPSDP